MPTTRRQVVASAIASLVCLTFMGGAHLPHHQQHRSDQTAVLDVSRTVPAEVSRNRPYRDLPEITTTTVPATPTTTSAPIPTRTRGNPPTAPSPRATPAPTVRTPTTVQHAISSNAAIWACIREHESGGNYQRNTGNGYYGAYQFSISTWLSMWPKDKAGNSTAPYSRADLAPPAVQDDAAQRLQARSGWSQWPQTSRMCGVR